LYNLQLDAAVAGQFNNISNVRLANESGDVVATATTTDANTVKFTNLSNTTLIEKDNSITYKVLVDINSNVTA
jgi:ornithine cyclodeaminase/alanine dehydrogenase-like protein (mu-crystallin family)